MNTEQIIQDWGKKKFKPVYWLEGEEPYYIDKLTKYAEDHILPEDQVAFNLTVFYGKDAKVDEVINACKRYPMFHDLQVVLLKEAQQLRDLDKLESYINNPLSSTIFIVAHKEKKVDGRSKLAKILKGKAELLSTKKLYDNELPEWASNMIKSKGLDIQSKALQMLVVHIGNDLQRIENEIEKLLIIKQIKADQKLLNTYKNDINNVMREGSYNLIEMILLKEIELLEFGDLEAILMLNKLKQKAQEKINKLSEIALQIHQNQIKFFEREPSPRPVFISKPAQSYKPMTQYEGFHLEKTMGV
jgi:DNA polymerase III delta subunit